MIPSGRLPRICEMASRTSVVARSTGVSIETCTKVPELPSLTVELISSTPSRLRTAASTFCVTCVSSSVGAAPGCEIDTNTAGKVISGFWLTFIRMNETKPARVSAAKRTRPGTGLRIDQAEMLRKFIAGLSSKGSARDLAHRDDLVVGIEECGGRNHHGLGAGEARHDAH